MDRNIPHLTRLLIAIEGYEDAETAITWGRALGAALHLPLTLVRILDPDQDRYEREMTEMMDRDSLELLASDKRLDGIEVDTHVRVGRAGEELPRLAAQHPGAILALVVRESGGESPWVTGSQLRTIVSNMVTPYLLIPNASPAPERIHSIVVGNDQSLLATEVLRMARVVAHSLDVNVVSVEAVEPATAHPSEFVEMRPVIDDQHIRMRGLASRTILAAARSRDAALIVVGSHGAGTSRESPRGSTSEWLTRHADRPVLVVPEQR